VILDASVGVPLVHPESDSGAWRTMASQWVKDARPVVVPAHFWLEIMNALVRGRGYDGRAAIEMVHRLDDVISQTIDVDRPLLLLAVDRAERHGLSLYDAAYVALAESIDAEIATKERQLGLAAGARVIGPGSDPPHRLAEEKARYGSERRVTWPDYSGAASYLASLRADLKRATTAS
jgi:predicted nucleic acid-binding protein